jgi:hypothetical protein
MNPQQLEAYNLKIEQEKIDSSPTAGKVGRPRVRPVIPKELQRGRGRPKLSELNKEKKRKAQIAALSDMSRKRVIHNE